MMFYETKSNTLGFYVVEQYSNCGIKKLGRFDWPKTRMSNQKSHESLAFLIVILCGLGVNQPVGKLAFQGRDDFLGELF